MAAESGGLLQWTIILVLAALTLSLVVLGQTVHSHWAAYLVAPREVATYIDTVDFSIRENESYDRDVSKVQRLEDKIRLGQLLREIQKHGDDLREELNSLLLADGATSTMRASARLLWASKRPSLDDRVRRLDLLRMRFLVVYLGIITSIAEKQPPAPPPLPRDPEKIAAVMHSPSRSSSWSAKSSPPISMPRRPPVRRLTTQAIGHQENVSGTGRRGWAGVVEELQRSPKMHKRHASIERAMSMSPE